MESPARDISHRHLPSGLPPKELGKQLFSLVMIGHIGPLFYRELGRLDGQEDLGLRILIRIDPSQAKLRRLQQLPWELLFDHPSCFLATQRGCSIVRSLDVARPSIANTPRKKLCCLAMGSSPQGIMPLNIADELDAIETALAKQTGLELVQTPARSEAIRRALLDRPIDILHFMGHGWSNDQGACGLVLEGEDGKAVYLTSERWAELVTDGNARQGPSLVVLNACRTAATDGGGNQPFQGVAQALVAAGIPAVIAMSRRISNRASIEFSRALYARLAARDPVDAALAEARKALRRHQQVNLEWATPALFLRGNDGHLFPLMEDRANRRSVPARSKIRGTVKIGKLGGTGNIVTGVVAGEQSPLPEAASHIEGDVGIEEIEGEEHQIAGVIVNDDGRRPG